MMERVFWVDDDPDLLFLIKRSLGRHYAVETYDDPRLAIAALEVNDRDVVVVAADMNMPGMNGAEFLALVTAQSPRPVRLMFTGAADQATASKAVNEGHVFRFLTKGAEIDDIHSAVADAVREYHSREAERRVLEDTMIGAVRSLMDVVALVQPTAFGRATRIRQLVTKMSDQLGCRSWEIELAASLSQLGCIVLPPLVMERIAEGREVAPQYEKMFNEHPGVGAELLCKIPRLENVTRIVRYQHRHFDGSGFPVDLAPADEVPLGSRLLKVAIDFDRLKVGGIDSGAAQTRMRGRAGWYDPRIMDALSTVLSTAERREVTVACEALRPGMILKEDLLAEDGILLARRGESITPALAIRLAANPPTGKTMVVILAGPDPENDGLRNRRVA
jgi:response regulator RpfG family c-di-GMP phosphodiesterase